MIIKHKVLLIILSVFSIDFSLMAANYSGEYNRALVLRIDSLLQKQYIFPEIAQKTGRLH